MLFEIFTLILSQVHGGVFQRLHDMTMSSHDGLYILKFNIFLIDQLIGNIHTDDSQKLHEF